MPRLSKIGAAALAAFGWTGLQSVTANFLVVAGGGGGGRRSGGGGGAGGYRTSAGTSGGGASAESTLVLSTSVTYTVTVGAGGAAATTNAVNGDNGSNSVFSTITSVGGGGGVSFSSSTGGSTGGSGGGGAYTNNTAGSGTANQGRSGGNGTTVESAASGGGGGASTQGTAASGTTAGAGGNGVASSISGSSVTYAGGGGGGGELGSNASGGSGGGGAGSSTSGVSAINGTANTGSGGGGGSAYSNPVGAGGSGVVIISYPAPQQFGGGVVTTSGSNVIHTFNTSGTFTPLSSLTASYLIVAGGGAGGVNQGGGGGAGGLLTGSGLTIDTNSNYVVVVGAGATQTGNNATTANGGNSSFSMVTTAAVGGGGAGGYTTNGASGGSGGGGGGANGSASSYAGGAGTSGQGFAGGTGTAVGVYTAGGGGGASAVGANSTITVGGNGGAGTASSISGTSVTYAGGGGGGVYAPAGQTPGSGGAGGGGTGGGTTGAVAGTNGTANLGGGGGGGAGSGGLGGNGGSGVVIISYAGATQQMAGGTVTISGGNVIHTFTSSGYLTPIKYVNNSLRFRSSASAYLNRTPATSSNRKTWTWSAWVKRGTLSSGYPVLFMGGATQTDTGATCITFAPNDRIYVQGYNTNWIISNGSYRDPAAWYHIVVAMDSTQATATNRLKLYVNGSEVSYSTYNNLTQNTDYGINQAASHTIAYQSVAFGNTYFDGYMTEINLIDGQQLTPNSFGTFNSYGVWQPITYGGSYGTNGFYLPFTGGSSYYGTFNGSNQYLQATLPATLTAAFTVEFFLYRSGTGNQFCFTLGDSNTSTGLEYYIGTTGTVNNVYSNGAQISTTSNVPTANGWSHVAITRDSSNVVRLFVNGTQAGSTWTSASAFSSTLRIGVEYYNSAITGYVNGNVSNFRVVNGTAVYTSNFVPPTSALTAVSGTSILTLQSSTIIDNSGNSLSITNNNTVTTVQAYPFTMLANQSKDYSPNGNNWTNNNIGVVAGSTLDVMTDVPTLTSATAANYDVLNAIAIVSPTASISDGNLTATVGRTGVTGLYSTMGLASGKFYWEVTYNSGYANALCVGVNQVGNISTSAGAGLFTVNSVGYYGGSGNVYNNSSSPTAYGSAYTYGDVVGVALDATAGTITFYKNNTSQGALTLPTQVSPWMAVLDNGASGGTQSASINFGQQPFKYTPPSGYLAVNTYNL